MKKVVSNEAVHHDEVYEIDIKTVMTLRDTAITAVTSAPIAQLRYSPFLAFADRKLPRISSRFWETVRRPTTSDAFHTCSFWSKALSPETLDSVY